MAFTTGSLVGSSTYATGRDNFFGAIEPAILASSSWTKVDSVDTGSENMRVYKCAASASGRPKDFYVIVSWYINSVNDTYRMLICEDYDATAHTFGRYPAYPAFGTAVSSDGSYQPLGNNVGFTLNSNWSVNSSVNSTTYPNASIMQGFYNSGYTPTFMVGVYPDGLVIQLTSASATCWHYLGYYNSVVTGWSDSPSLVSMGGAGGGPNYASFGQATGFTRMPVVPSVPASAYKAFVADPAPSYFASYPIGTNDFYTGRQYLGRFWVLNEAGFSLAAQGYNQQIGTLRGWLPNILMSSTTGIAIGDTLSVVTAAAGTQTYTCMSGSGAGAWANSSI